MTPIKFVSWRRLKTSLNYYFFFHIYKFISEYWMFIIKHFLCILFISIFEALRLSMQNIFIICYQNIKLNSALNCCLILYDVKVNSIINYFSLFWNNYFRILGWKSVMSVRCLVPEMRSWPHVTSTSGEEAAARYS